jgi:hypothetical protein
MIRDLANSLANRESGCAFSVLGCDRVAGNSRYYFWQPVGNDALLCALALPVCGV